MTNPGGEVGGPAIGLLGPLEVCVDGVPVALGGRQSRAVFTLLALSPGTAVPSSRLVRDLWDGAEPSGAVNTVQVYVSRLRRSLASAGSGPVGAAAGPRPLLRGGSQGYLLEVPPEAVDLHRFERHAGAGQAALAAGDPAGAAQELRTALALWRGRALADLEGTGADGHRARLEGLRLRALAARLEADSALGQDAQIVPELQELVRRHPLDERFVGQLMTALYRCGRQADALAAYREIAGRLVEELGVDPGPQLRERQAQVLRQDRSLSPAGLIAARPRPEPGPAPAPAPAPAPGSGSGSALGAVAGGAAIDRPAPPRPRTPLVGRTAELAAARALLATDDVRLVSVVGGGGTGKTRLALELARTTRAGRGEPRPVIVVPLDGVRDPDDLLPQIGRALGRRPGRAPEQAAEPWPAALAEALGRHPTLLVLDGVEQLVDSAGPVIAGLLDATGSLTVLVTSRTALRLRGEYLLPLGPLPLDDAVRLFQERAAAVLPGFAVTDENRAEVDDVCRMLDRLPLALELAAARIRVLSPAQMLERIGARLELLRGGPADLPERQRSMRALLDSSVQVLGDDELGLLGELSVFSGGWTLAAAEAVCDRPEPGLLDALEGLVDRSLVVADGSGRFSMLGTVREYAAQRLAGRPDGRLDQLRRRHAEHFARRARALADDPGNDPDSTARGWLEAEAANLTAALEHAAAAGAGELLAGLVGDLLDHWFHSGRIRQAERWMGAADAATLHPRERAHLLLSAGNLALVDGDLRRALPVLAGAQQAAGSVGDGELLARTLAARAVAVRYSGRPEQALDLIEQALHEARAVAAGSLVIRLDNERGELLDEIGHPEQAEPLFEAFRAWAQQEGVASNLAVALVNLAGLAVQAGDVGRAEALLVEALAAAGTAASAPIRGDLLAATGLLQLCLGRPAEAGAALRQAAPLTHAAGQFLTLPDTVSLLGAVALAEGDDRTAERLLAAGQAWREARGLAVVGRLARRTIGAAVSALATAGAADQVAAAADRALGAGTPFGSLAAVARLAGPDRPWLADVRTTAPRPGRTARRPGPGSTPAGRSPTPGITPGIAEPKHDCGRLGDMTEERS